MQRVFARKAVTCRLERALFRSLAWDVRAVEDGPDFDKSVMDGFALRAIDVRDLPAVLKVIEFVPAGRCPEKKLKKGECSRIATGAMVPRGADAVVMREATEPFGPARVRIFSSVRRGENIYRKGSDFRRGSLLLEKGTSLNTARVALLASQGFKSVPVFDAPSVALLSTGNEIVEPGSRKRRGAIWNSSASMLSYALNAMNIPVHYLGVSRDALGPLLKKIRRGLKYDCLIITGAVSVGELDLVPQALRKLKVRTIFHKVALRPGKPLLFAAAGDSLVFGLPGNPVSSFISFFLFIKPALLKMRGANYGLILEEGFLTKDVYNKSGRFSLLPARLKGGPDRLRLEPLRYSGSADLKAVAASDAFFCMGPRQTKLSKNAVVKFLRIKD